MKFFKHILFIILGFVQDNYLAQNLLANPSFEIYDSINCGTGGFYNLSTNPYAQVVDNWFIHNSPDYLNSVCFSGGYSVPNCIFGYSQAKQGSAYAGIATLPVTGGNSEYVYQLLSSPLQTSKVYCLSFYVSRADRKEYALKNIGAYFSVSTPTMVSASYISSIPQVINQNGFITDTATWTEIQGCFTAMGGEQYITIGNFNSNANTDTLYVGTNNPIPSDPQYAYYYIDDITLIDQATVGVNELNNESRFEVYPSPNNGIFTIKSKDVIQKIEISNIRGQVLHSETTSEKEHQLQLRNFEQGIYFIKLNYPNGMNITKKVIVNP